MSIIMYLLTSLRFLKFMGKMYAVWPLRSNTKKVWCSFYRFLWWFYFVNYLIATSIALHTCYHARDDITLATFSWLEFVSFMEAAIILINYMCYHKVLQFLLSQMEEYLIVADFRRLLYLKERAGIFAALMILITFLYSILVVLYFTNPAIASWNTLLTTAYYPPSIRSTVVDVLLYFHQIVVMFHTSVMVNVDAMVVLLIYVCTVRLKILTIDLQNVTHYEELKECIREHQYILCVAEKINYAVRIVVSKLVICFISYTVGAGLQIINPKATVASLQRFGVVLFINYVRLIMVAKSADDLSTASNNVAVSVYSTDWHSEHKPIAVTKIIIMLRCQKVLKIYVGGIMPTLNLAFITGIISTSISYFTTLRAITRL